MDKGKLVSALKELGDAMALIHEADFEFYYPIKSGGKRVVDVNVNEETWNRIPGPILVESISQTTSFFAFRLYKMIGKAARAFINGNAAPEEVAKWEAAKAAVGHEEQKEAA